MADSLTGYIVQRTRSTAPCVVKYMPYGALTEVSSGDACPINDHPLEVSYASIFSRLHRSCPTFVDALSRINQFLEMEGPRVRGKKLPLGSGIYSLETPDYEIHRFIPCLDHLIVLGT